MDTLNPRATLGGNNPPPYDPEILSALVERIDPFMKQSDTIRKDFAPIRDEEKAKLLTDHIAALRGLTKQVDAARVEAKRPHDDAGKAVQAAFTPLLDRLKRATDAMLGLASDFMDWKRAEAEKVKAAERAEAKRLQDLADAAAKEAAASGDLSAELEAEKAKAAASEAQATAERETKVAMGSATGAGRTISQREVRTVKITNINLLFVRFRDAPEVIETLERLATAHVRAKGWDGVDLPGTTTAISHVAV